MKYAAPLGRQVWRHVPNSISVGRLVAALVMLGALAAGRETLFKWLLLAALLSDLADGWIARRFDLTSRLGAQLDSVADSATWTVAATGFLYFHWEFVAARLPLLVLVLVLHFLPLPIALYRYGRLACFRTWSSRFAALSQIVVVMSLFFGGYQEPFLAVMLGLSFLACLEELLLLWLVPVWRPNIGGLLWVGSGK